MPRTADGTAFESAQDVERQAVELFLAGRRRARDPAQVAAIFARYPVFGTARRAEAKHREVELSPEMLEVIPAGKDRRIPTDSEPARADRGTGAPTGRPPGDPALQADHKRAYNRERNRRRRREVLSKTLPLVVGGHI